MTETITKINEHEVIPKKTDIGALGNRINMGTRDLHNKIDKQIAVKMAIALRDARMYRQGVQAFYHVFATIEKCLQKQLKQDNEWSELLRTVWKEEVARTDKIEKDLHFYYGGDANKFSNPIMPAQIEFVKHIEKVTDEKPYLLFAYMHVMYLALFAGGKVLRSSVSKATGLFPQKDGLKHEEIIRLGANMFTFDVEDEEQLRIIYKRDYELQTRNNLTEAQKEEIIDEGRFIFLQNSAVISEIERYNLAKITKKWSYFLVANANYIVMCVVLLLLLYFFSRRSFDLF